MYNYTTKRNTNLKDVAKNSLLNSHSAVTNSLQNEKLERKLLTTLAVSHA